MVAAPSYLTSSREEVGARLLLLREAMCGTHLGAQVEFAQLVGISPQAWNNYERGSSRIELGKALQLCEKVGASLDWIYLGKDGLMPAHVLRKVRDRLRARSQETKTASVKNRA
jgi:transcriptional regulator with XRE-family HTH domain